MFQSITNILNNFLLDNDFTCDTRVETDFAYYCYEDTIAYSLVVTERTDRLFRNFAFENGLEYDCGIFLLSFFHELGHCETMDLISDEVEEKCERIKENLTTCEEDCIEYFNLEDEITATLWAIDYINNNKKKIEKLAKKLQKAVDKLNVVEHN